MTKNAKWVLVLALFSCFFLLRNHLIPMVADDYSYSFIWDGDRYGNFMDYDNKPDEVPTDLIPLKTFKDVLVSQWSHYFTWGGRSIAHTLLQTFLLFDKSVFNVANTIIFAVLMLMIYSLSEFGRLGNISPSKMFWLIFAFWFCANHFLVTTLWETGAFNYLWMSVLQCAFLIPYAKRYKDKDYSCPLPLIAVLGFLAGWSNEPGGVGVFIITALFILRSRLKGESIKFMLTGFIFFCAGFAFMMLAPGNEWRVVITRQMPLDDFNYSPSELYGLEMFMINTFDGFLPSISQQLPLYVPILIYLRQNRKTHDDSAYYILALTLGAFAMPCAMMFSPEFPERACFPGSVLMIAASLCALSRITLPGRKFFIVSGIIGAVLMFIYFAAPDYSFFSTSLFFTAALLAAVLPADTTLKVMKTAGVIFLAITMAVCIYADLDFIRQLDERFVLIEQQRDKDLIKVPAFKRAPIPTILTDEKTMDEDYVIQNVDCYRTPYHNRNVFFALYHGLKQIMSVKE